MALDGTELSIENITGVETKETFLWDRMEKEKKKTVHEIAYGCLDSPDVKMRSKIEFGPLRTTLQRSSYFEASAHLDMMQASDSPRPDTRNSIRFVRQLQSPVRCQVSDARRVQTTRLKNVRIDESGFGATLQLRITTTTTSATRLA